MGQTSSSNSANRYLQPLPMEYERSNLSEVYRLKGYQQKTFQQQNQINSTINVSNPQLATEPSQIKTPSTIHANKNITASNSLPPYVKHFIILLNKFQTQTYLNHLSYRNQPQFRQFLVQVPFGEVEKEQKYTKVHLYSEEIVFTLNQVSNVPFNEMCQILYTSLIAYKYLYSYFGLFKIQVNMIGFTREGKAKVWLNNKLTRDKPLPIVSDINLKRYKEQESYMVDDLLTIFWNKVDRSMIPQNFTLLNMNSSIKQSRLFASRLGFSKVGSDNDLSKSMVTCLQNNLITDFSDGSFDRCLQYLQHFLGIQRPHFLKPQLLHQQDSRKISAQSSKSNTNLPSNLSAYKNYLPLIHRLIKTNKQLSLQSSTDLHNSKVNLNINLRQFLGNLHQNDRSFNMLTQGNSVSSQPLLTVSKERLNSQSIHFKSNLITNSGILSPCIKSTSLEKKNNGSSRSKPKVTFNSLNTSPVQLSNSRTKPDMRLTSSLVSPSNFAPIYVPISQPQFLMRETSKTFHNSSQSYEQTVNFSKNISTSQVHPVFVRQGEQNYHTQYTKNHDDKYQSSSIIDGVSKV